MKPNTTHEGKSQKEGEEEENNNSSRKEQSYTVQQYMAKVIRVADKYSSTEPLVLVVRTELKLNRWVNENFH